MRLIGLLILLASSWYLFKLSSNFFDQPTREKLSNSINNIKDRINKIMESFSKDKLNKLWEKYKQEGGSLAKNDDK